jgi:hypothetical protein
MAQPSPYTPGEVARSVPGRGDLLAEFDERLSVLVDLQSLVGRIHVAYGERGIGKTSLLRFYQRHAEERGVLCIWVTAGEKSGLISQILKGIRQATRSWPRSAAAAIGKHLDSATITVGLPGVASITTTGDPSPDASALEARELEAILRDVIKDRERTPGLILFIDEIQSADADGIRTLAYAWQHLQAEAPDLPVAAYAAGLPNAPEHIASAVTFSERFAYRPLEMLSTGAQVAALSEPAAAVSVTWTPDALERASELAGGYPYSVQLYGDAAWVAAGRPDPQGTISLEHVNHARQTVDRDMDALFAARWSNSTPAEKNFLSALAWLQEDTEAVERRELAGVRGIPTTGISTIRSQLLEKGLIQVEGRGRIKITLPGFVQYIRAQEDNPHRRTPKHAKRQ